MHMLYNSDSFAVVLFEITSARRGAGDARGRRARADAAASRSSTSSRARTSSSKAPMAETFKAGVEALMADETPSEEEIDDYIAGFTVARLAAARPALAPRAARARRRRRRAVSSSACRSPISVREPGRQRRRSRFHVGLEQGQGALAMEYPMQPAMPAALMLLLSLGVSTLAAYVALDLARRVRVLRTRAGALWLVGAASALATGVWSCQIIGVAAEPVAVHARLRRPRRARRLVRGADRRPRRPRRGQRPRRDADPRRLRGLRAGHRHRRHARPGALSARPAAGHRLAAAAARRRDARRRRRLHDGARRLLSRRRPHPPATLPWQATPALVLGVSLVVQPAARDRRRRPGPPDRLAARRPDRARRR